MRLFFPYRLLPPANGLVFERIFSKELEALLIGNERTNISQNDLAEFPQFLRFGRIELRYNHFYGPIPIGEKCHSFVNWLQPIKKAATDSNIYFRGWINKNSGTTFSDHFQLQEHIRNELLPICDSSRRYTFDIRFFSDENAGTNFIEEILQMDPINSCSTLIFVLSGPENHQLQLPIEAISTWLNRRSDGIYEKLEKRYLYIVTQALWVSKGSRPSIQNGRDLCDLLKKVKIILSVLHQKLNNFEVLKIQTFGEATFPVRPYILRLSLVRFEMPTIDDGTEVINEKTSEELSIDKANFPIGWMRIKRSIMEK